MPCVLLKHEIWKVQNKTVSENDLQIIAQGKKFQKVTAEGAKLKVKEFLLQILLS